MPKQAATLEEISDFIQSHGLIIKPMNSPIGEVYALVSGSINYACPYESMMLQEALWWANGVSNA